MDEVESLHPARLEVETGPKMRSGQEWAGLVVIALLAAGLRLWGLDRNGFGNPYYASAVRSMLVNASNFFFGSFDSLGLVTLDKPPVAIWIQALAAKVFGFRGLSLLVPQAVLGVASVMLTYHLVRRVFGAGAGLLAGLFLAVTPICVAVDRDNLPDPALVFVLLLAAWALSLAVETGRLRSLLLAAALVGIGFNVKMLAAFVVLPTFYLCYLAASPIDWRARLGHLTATTLVLVAVSLFWPIAVELTPKDRRPFIGGSRNNSALDLALGYNGLGRVFGGRGNLRPPGDRRPPGMNPSPSNTAPGSSGSPPAPAARSTGPAAPSGGSGGSSSPGGPPGPGGPFPRGMPPMFGGTPGLFRFSQPLLAGQITWLIPLAVLGAAVAAVRVERRWPLAPRPMALLLWSGWLGTHWVVFSFAQGIFHEYYTTIMGPAVAALAGIGVVALHDEWRREGRGYLPMALILTAAWQAYLIGQYADLRRWLLPPLGLGTLVGLIGLIGARRLAAYRGSIPWGELATGVGLVSILIGPACWSLTPVLAPGNGVMPAAEPSPFTGHRDGGMPPGPPPFAMEGEGVEKLIAFLRTNRHGERIFVAAPSAMEVSPIIIRTGESAVSLGGFLGSDPVLTRDEFARLVEDGQVRFVLISGPRGGPPGAGMPPPPGGMAGGPPGGMPFPPGGPGGPGNSELLAWVREHGKVVPPNLWQEDKPDDDDEPRDSAGGPFGPGVGPAVMFRRMRRRAQLFDLNPGRGPLVPASSTESRQISISSD